jgi:hypothetical protein
MGFAMTTEAARAILERYRYYSTLDARRDEDLGKADTPALLLTINGGQLSPREKGFYEAANADYELYLDMLVREKERLEKKVKTTDHQASLFSDRRAQELNNHAEAQNRLRGSEGPDSPKWGQLEGAQQEARTEYIELQDDDRPLDRVIHPRVAVGVLALLAISEGAINASSFALYLDGPLFYSYLAAFAAGGLLMWLAHLGGIETRTVNHNTRVGFALRSAVFYVGLAGLLMYFIAVSRQAYLGLQAGSASFDVRRAFQDVNAAIDLTKTLLAMRLEPSGWTLLLVNVGFYMMGGLATYFAHDRNRALEKAYDRMKRCERQFARQERRYNSKSVTLQRRHDRRLARIDARAARVQTWGTSDRTGLQQLQADPKATRVMIASYVGQRIASYRMGAQNAAALENKRISFSDNPELPDLPVLKEVTGEPKTVGENVHALRARADT